MAKTLVTGASGLIGSHVARALLARGDDVRVTLRDRSPTDNLEGLELDRVRADVTDRRAVRSALRGVERVYHVAGLTSLRASKDVLFHANVDGTRVVLEECLRAGVERVVHTSSVAAVGPAPRSSTADERQPFRGDVGVPYVAAKREAEMVAVRLAARGLPVVIVNPGHVFGRGDRYRSSTEIVRRFLARQVPAYVDGTLNVVDVEDVARGHLLAEERGVIGERYILGGRNFTLDRLFADLGRVSGVEPPAIKLPLMAALALARVAETMPGTPLVTQVEVRAASRRWAYRSTKAKRELGWAPRPHEETIEATVDWWREHDDGRLARPGARQPIALRVMGLAVREASATVGRLTAD